MNNLLDRELEKMCRKNRLTGVNIALYDNEKILYSCNYGYANKAQKLKSTNDSLYMIGSNTKVMTALGIFKLMEDGVLALDDDIRKFIPEFKIKSTFEYDKITVGDLLMHRAGLVCDLFNLILDGTRDFHEVMSELKNTYLTEKPGKMFAYSNVGYTVLGIVIERASGITYQEYIRKVIAEPLGIDIHFLQTAEERKPFSSTISLCYDKKGNEVNDLLYTMLPAGSNTYISMNDFVKFGQIFLNKDNTIFKKETLELMESLNVKEMLDYEAANAGYCLAQNAFNFGENVGKVSGHGGSTICHHSVFIYIPNQNVGVMVMTNSEQGKKIATALGVKVLTEYLKSKGLISGRLSLEHKYVQTSCDKYVGKFATLLGLIHIRKNRKGELVTKIANLSVKLIPCEDGFLKCCPNSLLLQLPAFKKAIKGMRLKLADYSGEEVLILEQTAEYYKNKNIIGCPYAEINIPQTFENACGSYEVASENLKNMSCNCSLDIEDGALILKIDALNSKFNICLKPVSDSLAFTQGFGRTAREAVILRKDKGGFYLTYSGIVFKKCS